MLESDLCFFISIATVPDARWNNYRVGQGGGGLTYTLGGSDLVVLAVVCVLIEASRGTLELTVASIDTRG